MQTIKGTVITADTDMYGYPINPDADYVVDHINCNGKPEYVTVQAWNNSHHNDSVSVAGDFAYLFQ